MSIPGVLERICSQLEASGIAYMLVGSMASSRYGRPRSTQDIDIVIEASAERLRMLIQRLENSDYYADLDAAREAHRRKSLFHVIDRKTGWKIDLIIVKDHSHSQEAFGRRRLLAFEGVPIYVSSVEDVIIAKLEGAKLGTSQWQLEDIISILKLKKHVLDESYLDTWIVRLELMDEWRASRTGAGFPQKAAE